MPFATVRGLSMYCEVRGSGPGLLFVGGTGGDLRQKPNIFDSPLAATFTVLAYDQRGLGRTDVPDGPYTMAGYAEDANALLDAVSWESCHIVGASFGGMVAAEVAATNPERVGKLVLIDPIGLWRDDHPVRNWMMIGFADLPKYLFADQNGPLAQMMTAAAASAMKNGGEAVLESQMQLMWSLACTAKFVWPIPDKGLKKRLHRIGAPALVLWGDGDRANPVVYAEDWQRRIKGAALRLLPGGHMVLHEAPEAAAAAVVEFLGP